RLDRVRSSAVRAPSHVVGRDAELAQLSACLDEARAGRRRIVLVTGEPGIGKTTLVDAFVASLEGPESGTSQASAGRPVRIGRGQCIEQYGAGEAYLPILEALGRLCRETGGERLIALLERHAPIWLAQMPTLLDAPELEALQRRMAGATRERMLREMTEALDAIAADQPLVLWLEDLHWSDVSTLELLAMLGRRRESARLLVIGTYRPVDVIVRGHPLREVKHELEVHGQCEELPLRLLTEEAVEEFLASRLDVTERAEPLRTLARSIHRRTEGNPLFVVNVVQDLVQHGGLIAGDGRCTAGPAANALATRVPESLRVMIERQLDQLDGDDRRVLDVASVAGGDFSAAAVAAGMDAPLEAIEQRCAALVRRGLFLTAKGLEQWPDGTVAAA